MEFLSENGFKTDLVTFYCYDYGVNASEAVERIATDQKGYHKCSLCVIVCCIAKNIVSNSKNGCTEKEKKTGPWWVLSTVEMR